MSRARLEGELANLHPASFGWALGCCKGDRGEAAAELDAGPGPRPLADRPRGPGAAARPRAPGLPFGGGAAAARLTAGTARASAGGVAPDLLPGPLAPGGGAGGGHLGGERPDALPSCQAAAPPVARRARTMTMWDDDEEADLREAFAAL